MDKQYTIFSIRLSKFSRTYKSVTIMFFVVLCVLIADIVFFKMITSGLIDLSDSNPEKWLRDNDIISFAPEAWLGLLGLVLGTLIIVISVASQSTPKLIDLYAGDETSLLYIWYIVIGSVHNMYLQLFSKMDFSFYRGSIILNTYIMLPAALLLAVPYVLYILRYTKTSNVIKKIYDDNLKRIYRIKHRAKLSLLNDKKLIADYQYQLFESLNQLDDLLEYVSFKEPKGDILNKISMNIQTYISIKGDLIQYSPHFFKISPSIGNDVSFKTMTGQFEEMQNARTFFEQKGYRLLGNAYIRLIEKEEFDLASLCAYELSECGRVAIEYKDWALVEVTLVRFNTFLRFGIKHGLKNKEARNLYNAIFHYSGFIHYIIQSKEEEFIKKSCFYLNIYVNEIFKKSVDEEKNFGFLVDAFTWEFKRILMELNENNLKIELQKEILGAFLKIDNLPDSKEETSLKGRNYNVGIRGFHIALALFYLKKSKEKVEKASKLVEDNNQNNIETPIATLNNYHNEAESQKSLAESIIIDILNDHEFMDKESLRSAVGDSCKKLADAKPKFWEDTDRGNSNLYYSEDTQYIADFVELFEKMLDNHTLLNRRNRPNNPPSSSN